MIYPSDLTRKRVIESLVRALKDPNAGVRSRAVVSLGKVGGPLQSKDIEALYAREKKIPVRAAALVALGMLGDKRVAPRLLAIARKRGGERHQRSFAALGLGFLGDAKSLPAMFEIVEREDKVGVQLSILVGLSRVDSLQVTRFLGRVLSSKRKDLLRSTAAYALGWQSNRDASRALLDAARRKGEQTMVMRSIALALGNHVAQHRVDVLREFLGQVQSGGLSKDAQAQAYAYLSLARQRDTDQTEFLLRAFEQSDKTLRPYLALALGIQGDAQAVKPLRAYIKRSGRTARRGRFLASIIALGLLGDASAKPTIERLTRRRKSEKLLWRYSATALGLSGNKGTLGLIEKIALGNQRGFEIRQATTVGLMRMGQDPLKGLVVGLRSEDKKTAHVSMMLLGETAEPKVAASICDQLLGSKDSRMRQLASNALGHLMDKRLEYGTVRQLTFGFNWKTSGQNHFLKHVFQLM